MREDDHVSLLDATLLDDQKRKQEASSDHIGLLGTFHIKSPAANFEREEEIEASLP